MSAKRGLGAYDLAGGLFIIAALIFLLIPATANRGVPVGYLLLAGGVALFLSASVATFAFTRTGWRK